VFRQTLVFEGSASAPLPSPDRDPTDHAVLVTYLPEAGVERPMVVDGRTVLERASPVVWLTFPGAHHDIGRFHTPDGVFTGYYANVLTPVEMEGDGDGGDVWHTTDLFLDVFVAPNGTVHLLDQEELAEALSRRWIPQALATTALKEAERLVREARAGHWPPPVAREWTLERARAIADPSA
jgi:predicted RNA-binding protein associated with RNAse of E/G family